MNPMHLGKRYKANSVKLILSFIGTLYSGSLNFIPSTKFMAQLFKKALKLNRPQTMVLIKILLKHFFLHFLYPC